MRRLPRSKRRRKVQGPFLGVFQLELPSQAYIPKEDVRWYLWALAYHGGIRFLRVFDFFKDDGGGAVWQPFKKNLVGKFVANRMNPKYLDRLIFIRDTARQYGIRLIFDPFYCYGNGHQWYPWTRGRMTVKLGGKGYDTWLWDISDVGVGAKGVYFAQVAEALGAGGFEPGTGNEICLPRSSGLCYWAYNNGEIWRRLGCVDFNADRKLWIHGHVHQLCGTFSDEVPGEVWDYVHAHGGPWPNNSHICVYHVVGEPAAVPSTYSARQILVGFSDDGVNHYARPDVRGHCETNVQGDAMWCGPSGLVRAQTFARAVKLWVHDPKKLPARKQVGQNNGRCFKYFEVGARETRVLGRTNLRAIDVKDTLEPLAEAYKKALGEYPANYHNHPEPR